MRAVCVHRERGSMTGHPAPIPASGATAFSVGGALANAIPQILRDGVKTNAQAQAWRPARQQQRGEARQVHGRGACGTAGEDRFAERSEARQRGCVGRPSASGRLRENRRSTPKAAWVAPGPTPQTVSFPQSVRAKNAQNCRLMFSSRQCANAVNSPSAGLPDCRKSPIAEGSSIVAANQRDAGAVTFWDTFDACVRQDAKAAIRDLQFPGIALTYRW